MNAIRKLSILLITLLLIGCSAQTMPQMADTVTPEIQTIPSETAPRQPQTQTPTQAPSSVPLPTQTDFSTSEQTSTTPIEPPIRSNDFASYFHLSFLEDNMNKDSFEMLCASCLSLSLLKDIRGYRLLSNYVDVSDINIGRMSTYTYVHKFLKTYDPERPLDCYYDMEMDGIPDALKRDKSVKEFKNDWSCLIEQDAAQSHDDYRIEVWYRLYSLTTYAPNEQNSIWYLANDANVWGGFYPSDDYARIYIYSKNINARSAAFYKNAIASGYPEDDVSLQIAVFFIKESDDRVTNDIVYWAMAPYIFFSSSMPWDYPQLKFSDILFEASSGEPDETEETVDIRPLILEYAEKYPDGFSYSNIYSNSYAYYDLEKCYVLDETMRNTH